MENGLVENRYWQFAALLFASSCGAESGQSAVARPYEAGDATLIGDKQGGEETDLGDCEDAACESVDEQCGDGAAADIILDDQRNVVDVICYERDVSVESVGIDAVKSAEAGNNTVLVLDGEADGLDVEGDVTISGNNALVYGEGPDVSVIGGTLDIEKNNAIVRGVRIMDDVTITKNNTQMAFCVIEGDLTITGNNTTLAECVVLGNVRVLGLNTVFVQNRFATLEQLRAKNLTCNDNFRFFDDDEDGMAAQNELGPEVICIDSDESPMPQSEVDDSRTGDAGIPSSADAGTSR